MMESMTKGKISIDIVKAMRKHAGITTDILSDHG
jgi:hypothetical protein